MIIICDHISLYYWYFLFFSNELIKETYWKKSEKFDWFLSSIIFVKNEDDYRYGGFTSKKWKNSNKYESDSSSFLFSLTNKEKYLLKNENNKKQFIIQKLVGLHLVMVHMIFLFLIIVLQGKIIFVNQNLFNLIMIKCIMEKNHLLLKIMRFI